MNIQLRDSKSLQDALTKRNAERGQGRLPKPQLHPELQNGIVDCDRSGFTIRSQVMGGARDGEINLTDAQNLKDFLAAPASGIARWVVATLKQGEAFVRIPQELIFELDNHAGKLVVRTQAATDITKLTSGLPSDHTMKFNAVPSNGQIRFTASDAQPALPTTDKTKEDLQVEAAKLGVDWDESASLATMLERMADARAAKKKPKQTAGA